MNIIESTRTWRATEPTARLWRFIRNRQLFFSIIAAAFLIVLLVKGGAAGVLAFQNWQHDKAIADRAQAVKDAEQCKASGGQYWLSGILPVPCTTDPDHPISSDPLGLGGLFQLGIVVITAGAIFSFVAKTAQAAFR